VNGEDVAEDAAPRDSGLSASAQYLPTFPGAHLCDIHSEK